MDRVAIVAGAGRGSGGGRVGAPGVVAAAHSIVPAQFQEAVVRRLPLTRTGTVGDTASGLFFLLSDASRWLTGHVAGVDGGQVVRL